MREGNLLYNTAVIGYQYLQNSSMVCCVFSKAAGRGFRSLGLEWKCE